MNWEVLYYQTERGESPVEEFLLSLSIKARAKCLAYLDQLEQFGNRLPSNIAAKVEGDLWELRPEFGGVEHRFLYFTFIDRKIVIVHALKKKRQKLKTTDIEIAQNVFLKCGAVNLTVRSNPMKLKSHRRFVQEQTENNPEFNREYELAGQQARFAAALAMQRERRGLTQQELSEMSGLSQPMVARYENGQIPTVPTLQRLAAALNTRVLLSSDAITFESLDDTRKTVHV